MSWLPGSGTKMNAWGSGCLASFLGPWTTHSTPLHFIHRLDKWVAQRSLPGSRWPLLCYFFFFFIICLCVARPPFWSIEKSFLWRGRNAKRETQKEQVMQEDKQVAANGQDDGFWPVPLPGHVLGQDLTNCGQYFHFIRSVLGAPWETEPTSLPHQLHSWQLYCIIEKLVKIFWMCRKALGS